MHTYNQAELTVVFFLCLQNLLVFSFIVGLVVFVTLVFEEKLVESWRIAVEDILLKKSMCMP